MVVVICVWSCGGGDEAVEPFVKCGGCGGSDFLWNVVVMRPSSP